MCALQVSISANLPSLRCRFIAIETLFITLELQLEFYFLNFIHKSPRILEKFILVSA